MVYTQFAFNRLNVGILFCFSSGLLQDFGFDILADGSSGKERGFQALGRVADALWANRVVEFLVILKWLLELERFGLLRFFLVQVIYILVGQHLLFSSRLGLGH